MPIDKSWISSPQYINEYANGLNMFLEFAFGHANGPVIKLTCRPFPQNYKIWYLHGEGPSLSESMNDTSAHVVEYLIELENEMEDMLNDAFGFAGHDVNDFDQDGGLQNNMGL